MPPGSKVLYLVQLVEPQSVISAMWSDLREWFTLSSSLTEVEEISSMSLKRGQMLSPSSRTQDIPTSTECWCLWLTVFSLMLPSLTRPVSWLTTPSTISRTAATSSSPSRQTASIPAEAEAVFAGEVKKMVAEKMKPKEQVTLEPYERDHAVVVGIYRPPPKTEA